MTLKIDSTDIHIPTIGGKVKNALSSDAKLKTKNVDDHEDV